jgi:hypothetical protein
LNAGFRVQQAQNRVALGFGHLFDSGDGDDAGILMIWCDGSARPEIAASARS